MCPRRATCVFLRHDLGAQHALAVGLHIQKKVLETGSIVAADGRCWSSHATAYSAETSGEAPPGPEGLRYDGNFHPQEQQKLSRGGVQSWAGVCGRGPKRTAMDSEQEGCTLHGMAGWDQEEYNSPHEFSILETRDHDVKSGTLDWRRKSRNGIRPSLGGERLAKWTGNTQECKMGSQAGFNRGWDSWLDFRRGARNLVVLCCVSMTSRPISKAKCGCGVLFPFVPKKDMFRIEF